MTWRFDSSWDGHRCLMWTFAVMHAIHMLSALTFAAAMGLDDAIAWSMILHHALALVQAHATVTISGLFYELRRTFPAAAKLSSSAIVRMRIASVIFLPAVTSFAIDCADEAMLPRCLTQLHHKSGSGAKNPASPVSVSPLDIAIRRALLTSDHNVALIRSYKRVSAFLAFSVVSGTLLQWSMCMPTVLRRDGDSDACLTFSTSPVAVVALFTSTVTCVVLCVALLAGIVAELHYFGFTAVKMLLLVLDSAVSVSVLLGGLVTASWPPAADAPVDAVDELLVTLCWKSALLSFTLLAGSAVLLFVWHVVAFDEHDADHHWLLSTSFDDRVRHHGIALMMLLGTLVFLASTSVATLRFTWLLFYATTWTARSKKDASWTARVRDILTAFLLLEGGDDNSDGVERRCAYAVSILHQSPLRKQDCFPESHEPLAVGFYLMTTFLSNHVEALAAAMDSSSCAEMDAQEGDVDRFGAHVPLSEVITRLGKRCQFGFGGHRAYAAAAYKPARTSLLLIPEVREVLTLKKMGRERARNTPTSRSVDAAACCTRQWCHGHVLQPQRVVRLLREVVKPSDQPAACGDEAYDAFVERVIGREGCRRLKGFVWWVWIPLHVVLCGGTTAALLAWRAYCAVRGGVRDPFAAAQLVCAVGCVVSIVGLVALRKSFMRNVTWTQRLVSALVALMPWSFDEYRLYRALLQYEANAASHNLAANDPTWRCKTTCCAIPFEVLPYPSLRDMICAYMMDPV